MFRVYPNSGGVPAGIVLYKYSPTDIEIAWGHGSFYGGPDWTDTNQIYPVNNPSGDTIASDYISKSTVKRTRHIKSGDEIINYSYNTMRIKALYDMNVRIEIKFSFAAIEYSGSKATKDIDVTYYYKQTGKSEKKLYTVTEQDYISDGQLGGHDIPVSKFVDISLKENDTLDFYVKTIDARVAKDDGTYILGRNIKFNTITITSMN